jgi:hypothetical protein
MIPAILGVALIVVLVGAGLALRAPNSTGPRAPTGGMFRAAGLGQPGGPQHAGTSVKLSTPTANGIVVGTDYRHDVSAPLRDLPPLPFGFGTRKDEGNENRSIPLVGHKDAPDPVVQRVKGPLVMPTPIVSFEGIDVANGCGGCMPPDTNGEVGPNHYMQMVNSAVQVWNKAGTPLGPAVAISTLWTGFGGPCETRNDGDPIVMYDQLADRWLVSQFTADPPFNECIAISTGADPTGTYHRYAFELSTTQFEDYPHFGVWPDGYYMSTNQFTNNAYDGPRPYVFNRASMLQGLTATFQTTANALGNTAAGFLPADLDGSTLPPAGAPNYFLGFGNPMPFYEFHVDWAVPANTTFTNPTNVANAPFTRLCPTQSCVPQPGTAVGLDGLGDRGMFRLAYRNFGTHQSLVGNFSVDAGGGQAGVRWYEIRNPGAGATLFQEGTYAPDAVWRWMGSVAQDRNGNLAVGYSASSTDLFPAIRYAGRLATDPLGQLAQGETILFTGLGSQTGGDRWGDYSDMTVDPTDDCTFWYTNEYNGSTGGTTWRTRIGSFKFPTCGAAQATPTPGTPEPTVTPGGPPTPCAIVFADVDPSNTFYTFIRCLACRGIVGGYPCGGPGEPCPGTYYRPNNNVTRGQVSKIVSESATFSDPVPSTQQTFEDVPPGSTFWLWVERLSTRGIIGGYPCGGPFEPCIAPDNRPYFRPINNVTRGQLSKITSGAAGWTETPTGQTFEDVAVGSTFYLYIERMASRGIIAGYLCGGPFEPCIAPDNRSYFRPNNNATRAQLAKIAANTFYPNCQTPAR